MEPLKKKLPLHAIHLRLLALALMLMDHLWATVVPGNDWMTFIGRLAFPIFAFQAAEGYFCTSDRKRYFLRLLVFAIVSEIPFNLLMISNLWFPFRQNVMFTLLLGLLGIHGMERAKQTGDWWKGLLILVVVTTVGWICFVDHGALGVLTVLAFGMFRHEKWEKPLQLVTMMFLHGVLAEGRMFLLGPISVPEQALAVFALIPIWLYNGEKGPRNRFLQYGSYVFYPAHMVILHLIRTIW